MKKQIALALTLCVLASLACSFSIGKQPTPEATDAPAAAASTPTTRPTRVPSAIPSPTLAAATTVPEPTSVPAEPTLAPTATTIEASSQPVVLVNPDVTPSQFTIIDANTGKEVGTFSAEGAPQYSKGYVAGGAIFFQGEDSKGYWRAGFDSSVRELEFINPKGEITGGNFLPSPDGKRIAWAQIDPVEGNSFHYFLKIANIDGSGEKALIDETVEVPYFRIPVGWSRDGQSLYHCGMPYGIGGYILFGGAGDLAKLNIKTGKSQAILAEKDGSFHPLAISPDESTVVYLKTEPSLEAVFHNIASGKERSLKLPAGYEQAGGFVWSPDSKVVAMTLAVGNPEKEAFTILRIDAATLAKKELLKDDNRMLRTAEWHVGNALWLTADSDQTTWGMDASSGQLKSSSLSGITVPYGWK
jgi:hypothetical protein